MKQLNKFIRNGGHCDDKALDDLFKRYRLGELSEEATAEALKQYNLNRLSRAAIADLQDTNEELGELFSHAGDHETVIEEDKDGKRRFVIRFK